MIDRDLVSCLMENPFYLNFSLRERLKIYNDVLEMISETPQEEVSRMDEIKTRFSETMKKTIG